MFAQTLTLRPPLPQIPTTRSHTPHPPPPPTIIPLRRRLLSPLASSSSRTNSHVITPPPPKPSPFQIPNIQIPLSVSQKAVIAELLNFAVFLTVRLISQKLVGDSAVVDVALKSAHEKNYENAIRVINYLGLGWAAWRIMKKVVKERDDNLAEIEVTIRRLEKCLNESEDLYEIEKSLGKLHTSVRKVIDMRATGSGGSYGDATNSTSSSTQ